MISLNDVKDFWEKNPLWTGESEFQEGSLEFFNEHRTTYISDCFGGQFDPRFLPPLRPDSQEIKILDLGCGIGFWVTELGILGYKDLTAADLTEKALKLTRKRLSYFNVEEKLIQQNAEKMTFANESFQHVNCQGVIHHTPDTSETIREISHILAKDGTASISVYYRNIILNYWSVLRFIAWPFALFGAKLHGRGRENILFEKDVDKIVRLYDGSKNPIGKSYTKKQFIALLSEEFEVIETYLHFFPARAFPFKIPKIIHKWLDKNFGFMIYATVKKKDPSKCVE